MTTTAERKEHSWVVQKDDFEVIEKVQMKESVKEHKSVQLLDNTRVQQLGVK